jgi:hypothetical protein
MSEPVANASERMLSLMLVEWHADLARVHGRDGRATNSYACRRAVRKVDWRIGERPNQ